MIRDLRKTKENLKEIADVINSFKSEAVQLRLLELLLSLEDTQEAVVVPAPVVEEVQPVEVKTKVRRTRKAKQEIAIAEEVKPKARGRKARVVAVEETPAPVVVEAPEAKIVEKEKPAIKKAGRKGKAPKAKQVAKPTEVKPTTSERPGPSVILRRLISENYFAQNRTIGEIVKYCLATFQYQYASTDLSGTLARMVKDNLLKREKNLATNTFEYTQG